jgi:hypothetical protein
LVRLIEILSYKVVSFSSAVVKVVCDVAVDIINDSHEPSDAKYHNYLLYDFYNETNLDDFIHFVLVYIDIVF